MSSTDPLSRTQTFVAGVTALASAVRKKSPMVKILGNMFAQPHDMHSHKATQGPSSKNSDKATSIAFKMVSAGPYRDLEKIKLAEKNGLKPFTGTLKPHTYSATPPQGRLPSFTRNR